MARVKRGNVSREKHKKILKIAKGFRGRASKCYRQAHQAVLRALTHSYKDRRLKKRDFRALWITRINAALIGKDTSYSRFMNGLKKNNILLNRKMLSELAIFEPDVFDHLVQAAVIAK